MVTQKERIYSSQDGLIIRPSGQWVGKKHHYWKRYADIFSRGMKKQWQERTYIDLFAGPGLCKIKGTGKEEEGSPLLSLKLDFTNYVFIEEDKECFEALKQRCAGSPKIDKIQFIQGDCNKEMEKVKLKGLSFAFIDPTGIDVHYETIQKLAAKGKVDLLMNIPFPIDIKRNFNKYVKEQHQKLKKFLGGWKNFTNSQDVLAFYKEKIKDLGYSTEEYGDIVVKNTKNVPLYFLFFATKHPRGLDYWRKISGKDEKGQMELGLKNYER